MDTVVCVGVCKENHFCHVPVRIEGKEFGPGLLPLLSLFVCVYVCVCAREGASAREDAVLCPHSPLFLCKIVLLRNFHSALSFHNPDVCALSPRCTKSVTNIVPSLHLFTWPIMAS